MSDEEGEINGVNSVHADTMNVMAIIG